jgi:excisionase family DNA binding protein
MPELEPDRLYTLAEVAWMFQVSLETVRNWNRRRLLDAVRTPGGHRRFRAEDLDPLLKDLEDG